MEGLGYSPNVFTYTILIDGYCNAKRVDDAFRLLEKMKVRNVRPNDATYRSLINGVFRSLPPNEAFESLLRWVKREPNLPKVVYDSIVYCLCNNYLPSMQLHFFEQLMNKVDLSPCLALVEALYKLGREGEGNQYLSWMLQEGLVTNVFSYNMVIDCFCKANMMDRAIENLGVMSERGILPNLVTFNTLIAGYCKARDVLKAREMLLMLLGHGKEILASMLKLDLRPDNFTYIAFISALCESGRFLEAKELFSSMEANGCLPDAYACNSFIDALIKSGRFQEAQDVWLKYKEKEITLKPMPVKSGALVG
ncbi:UNVERIFIED_CONTAM: hypothetical protein Sradi_1682200 [Sesamum radiatum]|uniref:Pentatricopeptide repeat-containing protein n=1 Tax=Sesamum radiatum TaxID=300843 RepID=A0AAW2UBZ6_SESRA